MDIKSVGEVQFHIQDELHTVTTDEITPETTLNEYLRKTSHLTGTKSMCLEGGCGSCVVCVSFDDPVTHKTVLIAVNSCLVSIFSCHGWRVYTVEGLGNSIMGYHPIQKALAKFNGTQCGFCSPGMVMNMYALYERGNLTMKEVENAFGGNICRCTGYRPILAAFKTFCKDADIGVLGQYPDIEDVGVCRKRHGGCERKCRGIYKYMVGKSRWIKLFTLESLLQILYNSINYNYMLVAGNTSKGVYGEEKDIEVYIDIMDVAELMKYQVRGDHLILGANITLTKAIDLFNDISTTHAEFAFLKKVAEHIDLIANVPVRNIGTIAGNLMLKYKYNEFPSDIFIILEALEASLTIVDTNKKEVVKSPQDFLAYNMKGKILKQINIPARDATFKFESYKITPRAQNAHAHVNAAFLVELNDKYEVEHANIVYGSISRYFIHATKAEEHLIGKVLFRDDVLQITFQILNEEIDPEHAPPEPDPVFRRELAIALFYKFVLSIAPKGTLSKKNADGGTKLVRPVSNGVQDYSTNKSLYPLTKPVSKIEALAQVSGEAQYLYDVPDLPNQLHAAFVLAKARPHSTILKIDDTEALKYDGVVAFFSSKDIPGRNTFMPKEEGFSVDEEIFCSGKVQYYFQPVGVIVARTHEAAVAAADLVHVSYKTSDQKPLLTVRDILKANAKDKIIHEQTVTPTRKGNDIRKIIKGSFDIYGQYHFNMETQYCSVIPTEDGLDMYPSTQWMDINQAAAAAALNIPANKINIYVRRLGGGYGAKISRNALVSSAAAVAAYKLNQPVKLSMPLTANMNVIGKRYPCSCDYEVGVNEKGIVQYLKNTFYTDFGSGGNENTVGDTIKLFTKNYINDTYFISANTTRSDTPAGTWCRAPGTTEGLTMIESIMEHIAYSVNMDPLEVRINNIDKVKQERLTEFINQMKKWANIDQRKAQIAEYNKENRWKKRGLSVVPMAYEFEIFGRWTVIVSVYHYDGTVAIAHGGVEMGQGINTKAAQVCAYVLGIPMENVSVKPSNNLISPNSLFSGGSITSEAVCYGVQQACNVLLDRMKPYREKLKNPPWKELVKECQKNFVDLTSTYMYSPKAPNLGNYLIYGVCASEVLVDILTGQHQVVRVDILEDTGNSISPSIDIGQVEGAFVMGQGYWTTEKLVFSDDGELLTNRTWNYKPPGAKDIPVDFRVKFPKNNPNPVGVLKSKATAEPPLCMSCSLPLAIRNAVASARFDANPQADRWYAFDGPSTVENTFMNSLNDYKDYTL